MREKATGGRTKSRAANRATTNAVKGGAFGEGALNNDTRSRPAKGIEPATELLRSTPRRQVWLAKTGIARRDRRARASCKHLKRLSTRSLNGVLTEAYRHVQFWRSHDLADEIEAELRRTAPVAVSAQSNIFLVLIRSALPAFDMQQASKWAAALMYADLNSVPSKALPQFLYENRGVEGAAGQLTLLMSKP